MIHSKDHVIYKLENRINKLEQDNDGLRDILNEEQHHSLNDMISPTIGDNINVTGTDY